MYVCAIYLLQYMLYHGIFNISNNKCVTTKEDKNMTYKYLIANGQPGDRAIYYTGKEDFHGGELWGNINEAYAFESKSAVFEYLRHSSFTAAPIIVQIADMSFNRCKTGYDDLMNGIESPERQLFHKFNSVSYITNS